MSGFITFGVENGESIINKMRFFSFRSPSDDFFLVPKMAESKPESFSLSFLGSATFLLSFLRSSSNFTSSRFKTRLSRPREGTLPSIEFCRTSRRAAPAGFVSLFFVDFTLPESAIVSSLAFLSFSSSVPRIHFQLLFRAPSFFSVFLSSKVGTIVSVSVLVLPLPGNGDGFEEMSSSVDDRCGARPGTGRRCAPRCEGLGSS